MSIRKSSSPKRKHGKSYSKPRLVSQLPQSELKRKVVAEVKNYDSYDQFINSSKLQRIAFGFENGSTLQLPTDTVYVLYREQLDNIDILPDDVPLVDVPPVRVSFKNERYILTEGYRRFITARDRKQPLRAVVSIDESAEDKLRRELQTDIEQLYNNNKS